MANFRPFCCAQVLRRDVFCYVCWRVCDCSGRSSVKSKCLRCVTSVHLIPLPCSAVVCLITQSMVRLKSYSIIQQPCLTPNVTLKLVSLLPIRHIAALDDEDTLPCGILHASRMRQKLFQWILSKAFSGSTKLLLSRLYHSAHCSMMYLTFKIRSVYPLSGRNPDDLCVDFG